MSVRPTSELPAANSLHEECPKCEWPIGNSYPLAEAMRRDYANGWECEPFCPQFGAHTEHLHVTCPRCGYVQVERCAS